MRLSQKQSVIAISFVTIGLFLFLLLFTNLFGNKENTFIPFKKIKPDIYLSQITYYLNQTNLHCKIKASNARWYQKKDLLILKDINATIFKKGDSSPIYVRSVMGFFYPKKGLLTLKGKVVLERDNTVLHTSLLFYNSKKNLIFTDKPVKIKTQGLLLNGIGMSYDLKTDKLIVHHQRSTIRSNSLGK